MRGFLLGVIVACLVLGGLVASKTIRVVWQGSYAVGPGLRAGSVQSWGDQPQQGGRVVAVEAALPDVPGMAHGATPVLTEVPWVAAATPTVAVGNDCVPYFSDGYPTFVGTPIPPSCTPTANEAATATAITIMKTAVAATATAVAISKTQNGVQICTFDHFDQAHARCLQSDSAIDLGKQDHAEFVWVVSTHMRDGNVVKAATLDAQRQDGTGAWATIDTTALLEDNYFTTIADIIADGRAAETLNKAIPIGALPNCNETLRLVAKDSDGQLIGSAVVTFTC